jgi:hypothetical protein
LRGGGNKCVTLPQGFQPRKERKKRIEVELEVEEEGARG